MVGSGSQTNRPIKAAPKPTSPAVEDTPHNMNTMSRLHTDKEI